MPALRKPGGGRERLRNGWNSPSMCAGRPPRRRCCNVEPIVTAAARLGSIDAHGYCSDRARQASPEYSGGKPPHSTWSGAGADTCGMDGSRQACSPGTIYRAPTRKLRSATDAKCMAAAVPSNSSGSAAADPYETGGDWERGARHVRRVRRGGRRRNRRMWRNDLGAIMRGGNGGAGRVLTAATRGACR